MRTGLSIAAIALSFSISVAAAAISILGITYKTEIAPVVHVQMTAPQNPVAYWSREENQEELKSIEVEHNASKQKWLDANPPVHDLFDEDRTYDTAYVIEYLKENKISGHCALVWRPDVVCAENGRIIFPTSRE